MKKHVYQQHTTQRDQIIHELTFLHTRAEPDQKKPNDEKEKNAKRKKNVDLNPATSVPPGSAYPVLGVWKEHVCMDHDAIEILYLKHLAEKNLISWCRSLTEA